MGGDVLLEVVLVVLGFSSGIWEISIRGLEGSYRVDDSLNDQPYQLGVHCLFALLSDHALLLVIRQWFSEFFFRPNPPDLACLIKPAQEFDRLT